MDDYLELVALGKLAPDDRVELLEGVVTAMSPQSPRHAAIVMRVAEALRVAGGSAALRVQAPLRAGPASLPEPDVALVPGRTEDYLDRHPDGALLVVEVADSSLAQDRLSKAAIYARAQVQEYWIVDLVGDQLQVFRQPGAAAYAEHSVLSRGQSIAPLVAPSSPIAVADLLPPA